jgi:predicted GH43/DUF377 family glycosyl hydrolase
MVPVTNCPYKNWNATHSKSWREANKTDADWPDPTEELASQRLNPAALFRHGYNPHILKMGTGYLCAYRAHRWNDLRTCIAIAVLDEVFNVKNNQWLEPRVAGLSTEDPKLFWHQGKLHLSYVQSHWPKDPQTASVHYGEISQEANGWSFKTHWSPKPSFMRQMEKNWVFFNHDQKLFCIYEQSPKYQIMEVIDDKVTVEYEAVNAPKWKYGPIRGGSAPVKWNDKWIRIVHSTSWNYPPPTRHRYWIGAVEVDPSHYVAPFKPIALSRKPIAGGSAHDHVHREEGKPSFHAKNNVLFPGSAWLGGGLLNVSMGINDCQSWLLGINIDKGQLNLDDSLQSH